MTRPLELADEKDYLLSSLPPHLAHYHLLEAVILQVLDEIAFCEGQWLPNFASPTLAAFGISDLLTSMKAAGLPVPASVRPLANASPVPPSVLKPVELLPVDSESCSMVASSAQQVPAYSPAELQTCLLAQAARNRALGSQIARYVLSQLPRLWTTREIDVPPGADVVVPGAQCTSVYLVLYGHGSVSSLLDNGKLSQFYGVSAGELHLLTGTAHRNCC